MSKQTPFFKFDAMQWLGGSIQQCTLEEKGLFIDLCALYWKDYKPVKIDTKFKVRYRNLEGTLSNLVGTLSDLEFIKVSEAGITVNFLDDLMNDREKFLEKCSKAGKKSASIQGTSSNKKEERRKKNVECREKKVYNSEFEKLWKLYEMKGSKSIAYERWLKMADNDRILAFSAVPAYFIEKPDKQYRKDLERYLSNKEFEGVLERKLNGINNKPVDDRENRDYGL